MLTTIIMSTILAGPCGTAIDQAVGANPAVSEAPPIMPASEWLTQVVGNTTIELPVPEAIETGEYQRTAPDNYKTHSTSKYVPLWCPAHGWACGMQQAVEDLAGHLQSVHGESLERLNEMGRAKWADLHADIHWAEESTEKQKQVLSPAPAKPAASTCGPGGCPSQQGYRLFGRRR